MNSSRFTMRCVSLFIANLTLLTAVLMTSQTAVAQASAYNTDRGFVHPGGLHTQADFDRVKQQLEAGNALVKQAYQRLTTAAYAQATVQTYPVEVIVRGGGNGENYINACRGATMAYQNALRWKIGGSEANAKAAVSILMAWANTTKDISGDSNYALASGLYGYQFAQAAELMRDYEGWKAEEFEQFQQWMLTVWYPKAIGFLRGRNGTWENVGKWWQAPGHYWSNWGLCNALCVAMIGILCDDVFLYNQGMSYFKYDQCGTFTDPRTAVPIQNNGLTEFLGNLVVTTYPSDLETGAYGLLGQMNESGRDTGHSAMALGLAIDIAKVGWSQGDDLFAYMDHRLAAGIEYVAAQTQSIAGLPWVNYHYGSSGYYYSDSRAWLMTGPALGAQMRPYWGSVIGIYEGVKGVRMPFSEVSYANMGIDGGGEGGTSGGYDHLGYSVLMNTREPQLCPAELVPTELTPSIEYSGSLNVNLIPSLAQERTRGSVKGKVISHNELGGLVNPFTINNNTCVPAGQTLTLMPQLPDGEEDTGRWRWNTGQTTRDITVPSSRSYVYRVTYTNARGVESQLCFPIAAAGDCRPDRLTPIVTIAGQVAQQTTSVNVLYGRSVTFAAPASRGWGTYKWSTGATTETITRSFTADASVSVDFKNQGGAVSTATFDVHILPAEPYVTIAGAQPETTTSAVVPAGTPVTLGLTLPTAVKPAAVTWSNGATGATLTIADPQTSTTYSATFTLAGTEHTITFQLYVASGETTLLEPGCYRLRHIDSDRYLTAHGKSHLVTFETLDEDDANQIWWLERSTTSALKYGLVSLADHDSLRLASTAKLATAAYFPYYFEQAIGTERLALHSGTTASNTKYWDVDDAGAVVTSPNLAAFPFQLLPASDADAIHSVGAQTVNGKCLNSKSYDLAGREVQSPLQSQATQATGTKYNVPRSTLLIHGGKKILVK